jgi:hypothetical protein
MTFAGPTPGNAAFAKRIETQLHPNHLRIANTNDVVTHAWETGQLAQIPKLYGAWSAGLQNLVNAVADSVANLGYTHASINELTFAGKTDSARSLVEEFIHQHMDAYLERFGLLAQNIDALTFFLG